MDRKPFTVDEYVRWSDVDKAGIIFYGAYVRFFEIGETELFRAAGIPYGEVFERFDCWLPRVHLECDFKYPARLDDRLRVAAYFTHFGNSSIRIDFDILHLGAEQMAAKGHVVLCCVNKGDNPRPIPLPEELKKILAPYRLSEDEARAHLNQPG